MTTIDETLLPDPVPPERRGWRTGDFARAAGPLRLAMAHIAILALPGLFWSAITPEAPSGRPPRRPPTSGTTTL